MTSACPIEVPGPEAADPGVEKGDPPAPTSLHAALQALSMLARLHQVKADPDMLLHQLGRSTGEEADVDVVLLAARHLGLKARAVRCSSSRLAMNPLPALALAEGRAPRRPAQCDGQRVLYQDPSARQVPAAGR